MFKRFLYISEVSLVIHYILDILKVILIKDDVKSITHEVPDSHHRYESFLHGIVYEVFLVIILSHYVRYFGQYTYMRYSEISPSFLSCLCSSDHRLLEESIMPLYVELVQNHSKSGNVASLIRVFLSRATELKASAQCDKSVSCCWIWKDGGLRVI